MTLLLRGPAAYSLQEYADELVDEDNFVRYLPLVVEGGRTIYVEDSFEDLAALKDSPWRYASKRRLYLVVESLPEAQRPAADEGAEVFVLTKDNGAEALRKIFAADAVAVWGKVKTED